MKKLTKTLSLLLLVCMFCTLLPTEAFAATKPAAPVITVSNYSDGKIKITWKAVEGATAYQVYRATSKTGKYTKVVGTKELEFKDTETAAGATRYYKVRAMNGKTAGAFSKVVSGKCLNKPAAPTIKTAVSGSAIKVSWGSVTYATTYLVYRSDSKDGTYSKIGSTKEKYYNDSTAKAGMTYYYKVRAKNGVCNGALSKAVSGKVPVVKPAAPTISVTATDSGLKISYSAVKGATSYIIYRSESQSGTYTKIGTTKELNYTDTTVTASKTYYYKAKSKSAAGTSGYSNIKSGKFTVPAPQITVSSSGSGLTVSYAAVKNATSYLIYRSTSKSGKYTKIGSTKELSYTDTFVAANKTYYYKVKAKSAAGTSDYGNIKYGSVTQKIENKLALKYAKALVNQEALSEMLLYDRLLDAGYSGNGAQYAVDYVNTDWNEHALAVGMELYEKYGYSKSKMKEVLTGSSYSFSKAEAAYAVDFIYVIEAAKEILADDNTLDEWRFSDLLRNEGYSYEAITYALEYMNVDWKENAVAFARKVREQYPDCSIDFIQDMFVDVDFDWFEVKYALNNMGVFWGPDALVDLKKCMSSWLYGLGKNEVAKQYTPSTQVFTAEEIEYALDNIDWKEVALTVSIDLWINGYAKDRIYIELVDIRGFTDEEAQYAIEHLS